MCPPHERVIPEPTILLVEITSIFFASSSTQLFAILLGHFGKLKKLFHNARTGVDCEIDTTDFPTTTVF